MSRPKHHRNMLEPPRMQGFNPFGISDQMRESVILQLDEYESVRLLDYIGLNQEQAAVQMNVSRPTLTRIYDKARKHIADALVNGKQILIEGGEVRFEKQWFRCRRCFKLIEGMQNHTRCCNCEEFGNDELVPVLPYTDCLPNTEKNENCHSCKRKSSN